MSTALVRQGANPVYSEHDPTEGPESHAMVIKTVTITTNFVTLASHRYG